MTKREIARAVRWYRKTEQRKKRYTIGTPRTDASRHRLPGSFGTGRS